MKKENKNGNTVRKEFGNYIIGKLAIIQAKPQARAHLVKY